LLNWAAIYNEINEALQCRQALIWYLYKGFLQQFTHIAYSEAFKAC